MAEYNTPQLPALGDIYNQNPGAFYQSQQIVDQGMQGAQQNIERQRLQNLYDQQNNPLRVQQLQLANQTTQAQLPGIQADSQSRQLKAEREAGSQQEQLGSIKKKFLAEASDSDIQMLGNEFQKMAYSNNPQIRAKGLEGLKFHKDILKEKEMLGLKEAASLRQIQEQGNQARLTQAQAIEAGKYKGSGGGSASAGLAGLEQALASGKVGFEKAAAGYFSAAQEAYRGGNADEGDRLMNIANQYNNQYIQGRQAGVVAGQAGKVDVGAMGSIPVRPQQPTVPFGPSNPRPSQAPVANDSAAFQKAFGSYEPNKYDYRMGPNGPQRKLKDK